MGSFENFDLAEGPSQKFTEEQKQTKLVLGRGVSQKLHLKLQVVSCVHTCQRVEAGSGNFHLFRGGVVSETKFVRFPGHGLLRTFAMAP